MFQITSLASRSVVLFLLLVSASSAAPAPDHSTGSYVVPISLPNGVADASGKVGYFIAAKGGLEAVDLATGRVLWKTEGAAYPLAVWGKDPVVAVRVKNRPNRLRILVLGGDGAAIRETQELEITGHREGDTGQWVVRPFLDGDVLLLDWSISWNSADGLKGGGSRGAALSRVNLRTGQVAPVSDKEKATLRPPFTPGAWMAEELKGFPQDTLFVRGAGWSSEPQRLLDGQRVGIVWRKRVGRDELLTLRTWDAATGKRPETTQLLQRVFGCHLRASADNRYLFFQHKEKSAPGQLSRYTWEVYRVATGKHLGTFLHNAYTIEAGIAGDRVFVIEYKSNPDGSPAPPELHAVDLKTGKLLWKRPPPDYSYGFRLGP
jgi:outer membrane protein assembly factor BamB